MALVVETRLLCDDRKKHVGVFQKFPRSVDSGVHDEAARGHLQRLREYPLELANGTARHLGKLFERYVLGVVLLDVGNHAFQAAMPFRQCG